MNTQKTIDLENEMTYTTSWDHLQDELKRLDIIIHLCLLKQRHKQPANLLDQFKGLVLSEEEVFGLLSDAAGPQAGESFFNLDDAGIQSLFTTLRQLEVRMQKRRAESLKTGVYLSLDQLSKLFGLNSFEEKCILICLAPELDRKYEKLYAYLQDDVTRKKPSVDLALTLFCQAMEEKLAARMAFDPQAPLLKYRLLQMGDDSQNGLTPLLSRFLKLDDRIAGFLLGFGPVDARLQSAARLVSPCAGLSEITLAKQFQGRLREFVREHFREHFRERNLLTQNLVFYFYGPYGAGKRALAEALCHDLKFPLIISNAGEMADGRLPFKEAMWLLGRETLLQQAALCLENIDYLLDDAEKCQSYLRNVIETSRTFSRLTFLTGSRSWQPQGPPDGIVFMEFEFPVPDDKARKSLWNSLNGNYELGNDVDLGVLAGKFRFTPGQIRDTLVTARNLACWRSPAERQITMADLHTASRLQSNQQLGKLARKISPRYTWEDIVLPPEQINLLSGICKQVKYRHIVYGEWGFDRKMSLGKGHNVLFTGPPGTGKTMAAEVIAQELELDLYKIDLSQVVSKYIGETEKNLQKIFQEAQTSNAILFFDEADALFGKRSEVKDAHDRYANIEIAYLLQKMEEYDGITILATNLRNNLDEAFVRRIQFTVEFPFPNEEYRERIWLTLFPQETPRSEDLDLAFLAKKFNITGGNIKNIVLAGAFLAAETSGMIKMEHLIRATKRELQKMGKLCLKEDFGEYYHWLE